ncbi:MAG: ATP-grasp domain-containing protein [Nitrososphaerota archaeon]|nr:ATP-grasp domain-containing protein [Nitrososphaerota archaeon]
MEANVLVTTAGTIVAQGIMKSLKLANKSPTAKTRYKIYTTDMSPEAAGLYRGDVGFLVPPIVSSGYVESVIKICKAESIKAVYVGADEELLIMAKAREEIQDRTGAVVISNPPDVISTCVDKWKTFQFLRQNNLPCPDSALPEEADSFASICGFPAIVKPREGHGSLQVYKVKNKEELNLAISSIQKSGWRPIIQELIPGEDSEFTTGVTVDFRRNSVMSSIAMRRILESGQTYKAFIDDFKEVRSTAEEASLKLGARGPINIQGRFHDGKLKIFEINPRFSASTPMRATAGVNEADIIFRNSVLHEDIKVDSYEHLVCLRYWNEVYVPLSTYSKTAKFGRIDQPDSFIPEYF